MARGALPFVVVACATLTWVGSASGHVGDAEGRSVALAADGTLLGASTTWGLVLLDEGCPRRVCEEATFTPRWTFVASADRALLGTSAGLLVTVDRGCSYLPGPAPLDELPVVYEAATADGSVLAVATAGAEPERVWVSTDRGLTFTLALEAPGFSGRDLTLAGMGDERALFFAGVDDEGRPLIHHSEDLGASWSTFGAFADDVTSARVLGPGPGATCVLAVDRPGEGTSLLQSSLNLQDEQELGSFEGLVTAYACFAGFDFVVLEGSRLLRAPSGSPASAFVEVEGPTGCLQVGADDRLWGCAGSAAGGHFLVSDDGIAFTPILPQADVDERWCAAGTAGATVCADVLGLTPRPDDGVCGQVPTGEQPEPDAPPPGEPIGCSCAAPPPGAPSPGALAGLLVLAATVRRRRASSPPSRRR